MQKLRERLLIKITPRSIRRAPGPDRIVNRPR
jgi:hypothetical protein